MTTSTSRIRPRAEGTPLLETAHASLPSHGVDLQCIAFRRPGAAVAHLATMNLEHGFTDVPLVRIHSECLTGDVFGSQRCDCGDQLSLTLEEVAASGGILIYMRGHEGRGIGLFEKIRAYSRQDEFGEDTVDANLALGHGADERRYGEAADFLRLVGATRVRLATNNPTKVEALEAAGIVVERRVPCIAPCDPKRSTYLSTKVTRMGHFLDMAHHVNGALSPKVRPLVPAVFESFESEVAQ